MSHSFHKIWIHAIWATKERLPLIEPKMERQLHEYMREQLVTLGCPVRIINGMDDHVHCLFMLSPQKSISEVIKQVKGSSSHWVNQQGIIQDKFAWQTGYAAYSVSESVMDRVFQYVKNQKEHHAKQTFQDEFDGFARLHQTDISP